MHRYRSTENNFVSNMETKYRTNSKSHSKHGLSQNIIYVAYFSFFFFFSSSVFLAVYDLFLKYGKNSCMHRMDNFSFIYSTNDNLFLFVSLLLANRMK